MCFAHAEPNSWEDSFIIARNVGSMLLLKGIVRMQGTGRSGLKMRKRKAVPWTSLRKGGSGCFPALTFPLQFFTMRMLAAFRRLSVISADAMLMARTLC